MKLDVGNNDIQSSCDVMVGHYDYYDTSSWWVSHGLHDEHHDVMATSSFPVTSGLKLVGFPVWSILAVVKNSEITMQKSVFENL